MLIKTNWHNGRKLNICVVYAPNVNGSNGHGNAEFWKTIHQYFEQNPSKKPDILAGDMNVVESGMVDRLPAHNDPEEATEALDNLKILTNLHDGWRDTYPDKKAYTFHQTATGSQSRLDRIYATSSFLTSSREWNIEATGIRNADHKMVTVHVSNEEAPSVVGNSTGNPRVKILTPSPSPSNPAPVWTGHGEMTGYFFFTGSRGIAGDIIA
ncbi:hypothetical protein K435DRAFT_875717 [Dendrothele bispora CBS 962.96]|uniref:Endonuclease/exonuclease/phosphatase domain-containing protein n=1 Tax=Dendrothele bispora (strain CBS 962.96) TaxID=1314807 RepID=A0A4S8KTP4_DENBC|nr:hypothetical protein K435DRAFT_875717 [Dendrothele bispora CBS 962.96]